jgi:hypothetical protein
MKHDIKNIHTKIECDILTRIKSFSRDDGQASYEPCLNAMK